MQSTSSVCHVTSHHYSSSKLLLIKPGLKRGHMPQLPCVFSADKDDVISAEWWLLLLYVSWSEAVLHSFSVCLSPAHSWSLERSHPARHRVHSRQHDLQTRQRCSHARLLRCWERLSPEVLTDVMCGCHRLTIQTLRYNDSVPNVNSSVAVVCLISTEKCIITAEYLLWLVYS